MTDARKAMKKDWDQRARRDAFFYIASWRKDWSESSFFDSGRRDYSTLVEPVLKEMNLNPSTASMAEVGCGAGRMTRTFAKTFAAVTAVDISAEMLASARHYLSECENVSWVLTDGTNLCGVPSETVDFVFSYLVLQHFPTRALIFSMIREMLRILRPGGVFLFQFNGSARHTMNLRGRAISSVLDGLCTVGLRRISQALASLSGIDSEMIGATWRGAALQAADVEAVVCAAGGRSVAFIERDTPLAWCYGRLSLEGQS